MQTSAMLVPIQTVISAALAALIFVLYLRLQRDRYLLYWSLTLSVLALTRMGSLLFPDAVKLGMAAKLDGLSLATAILTALVIPALVSLAAVSLRRKPTVQVHLLAGALLLILFLMLFLNLQSISLDLRTLRLLTIRSFLTFLSITAFLINFVRHPLRFTGFVGNLVVLFCSTYAGLLLLATLERIGLSPSTFASMPSVLSSILLPLVITFAIALTAIEAARKANAEIESVWDASAVGMVLMAANGEILRVNPAFRTLSGVSSSDLLHDAGTELRQRLQSLLSSSLPPGGLKEFTRADGRKVWLEITASPIPAPAGATLFTVRDVTRRMETEQTLKHMEELLRRLTNHLSEGVTAYDMDQNLVYLNPAMEKLTGYSATEMRDLGHMHWVHGDDQVRVTEIWDRLFRGQGVSEVEYRIVTKDGLIRWVSASWSPVWDDAGGQIGAQGSKRDVTEHKLAEERLRESEENFRTLFDESPFILQVTDISTGRYVNVNRAFCQFSGLTKEQVLGRSLSELNLLREPSAYHKARAILAREGRIDQMEVAVNGAGNVIRYGLVSSIVIRLGGRPCILTAWQDITDRKQAEADRAKLEEDLRQAQKMESVGRLAGGIAHDFNNLLTVINGYSQLALKQIEPHDPLYEKVNDIREAGERAAELTRQLLAFSRRQVLQPETLRLSRILSDADRMLRRLIGTDIELICRQDPSPPYVLIDAGQIMQVILNLAVNARDAMPHGGTLVIETASLLAGEEYCAAHPEVSPGSYASLTVRDSGLGMDSDTVRQIFEPFFTTKTANRGTGLGLATVYGIVKQSGGHIWVESTPGSGTTFTILFPVAQPPAAAASRALPAAGGGSETILLVEDQPAVRHFAGEALRSLGYTVIESASAGDALRIAADHPSEIHLLFTDIVMPGLRGPELARRVCAIRPATRVLFMSGFADSNGTDPALNSGTYFLQKPFSPEELAHKIREVLKAPVPQHRILIVDDDPAVRALIAAVLEQGGYNVQEASDGEEALRLVGSGRYDVMITDLVMPGREGIETIRQVVQEHPSIKIIAISGAFEGKVLSTAGLIGASATLLKPVNPDTLLSTVRDVL